MKILVYSDEIEIGTIRKHFVSNLEDIGESNPSPVRLFNHNGYVNRWFKQAGHLVTWLSFCCCFFLVIVHIPEHRCTTITLITPGMPKYREVDTYNT